MPADQRKGIPWGDWGEGVVLYAGSVLPPGLPAGAYPIEAALLEPGPGVTSGRHSVPLPDAGAVRGTIR